MTNKINGLQEFGRFTLDAEKKVLWCENKPVNLQPKEVELLCVLAKKRGEVVTKNELLDEVWKDSFVVEGNLTKHIHQIRKIFKEYGEVENLIETVSKRGYRFIGNLSPVLEKSSPLIIEKHSFSRTVIEETETIPQTKTKFNKRIWIPVLAVLAFISTAFGFYLYEGKARSGVKVRKIAVAKISPLLDNEDEKILALGIKEKLLMNLGNLKDLEIQNVNISEDEIAKISTADAVLLGSVQKVSEEVRVNLRLLSVSDKKQIWSASFDENQINLLKLQDEISRKITDSLELNLTKPEKDKIYKRYTENQAAYDHYLRGRYFFDKRNTDLYDKAIAEFNEAIRLDPNYALAYTGLADVYSMKANANSEIRNETYEKALQNANKALELDENLAEAYTSIAWIKRIRDWDWNASEIAFKRAIELNPNYVNAHQWYGHLLAVTGRLDEALVENGKAEKLEPFSKSVLSNRQALNIFSHKYDEALRLSNEIVEMDSDKRNNVRILSLIHINLGNDKKVIEVAENYINEVKTKSIGDTSLSNLAVAYYRTGEKQKAMEIFKTLEETAKNNSETAFRLAQAYAWIGKNDEAIEKLQKCFAAHDDRMVWLKIEPSFENLHNDSRYKELLRKMNLE